MAQVLIRNLPADVVERLKRRAALNGRSLEAELRLVLEREAGPPASRAAEAAPRYGAPRSPDGSGVAWPAAPPRFDPFEPLPNRAGAARRIREQRDAR